MRLLRVPVPAARRNAGPQAPALAVGGEFVALDAFGHRLLEGRARELRDLEQRSPILLRDLQAWAAEGERP